MFHTGDIELRILRENDAQYMLEWMKNIEISKNFAFDFSHSTLDDAKTFIANAQMQFKDKSTLHYAITRKNKNEYLGTISLKNLNFKAKNAEYAIVLRECAQGKNIAKEATKKILKIAFHDLNFNRVYLNVLHENIRAIKFYQKIGFSLEGIWKEHLYIRSKVFSVYWFAMLKKEYKSWESEEANKKLD